MGENMYGHIFQSQWEAEQWCKCNAWFQCVEMNKHAVAKYNIQMPNTNAMLHANAMPNAEAMPLVNALANALPMADLNAQIHS